jgi:hypothetical protein
MAGAKNRTCRSLRYAVLAWAIVRRQPPTTVSELTTYHSGGTGHADKAKTMAEDAEMSTARTTGMARSLSCASGELELANPSEDGAQSGKSVDVFFCLWSDSKFRVELAST